MKDERRSPNGDFENESGAAAPGTHGQDPDVLTDSAIESVVMDAGLAPSSGVLARFRRNRPAMAMLAITVFVAAVLFFFLTPGENRQLREDANTRVFICAKTGKAFSHRILSGEVEPIISPFTNEKTAWIAEKCYWTREGKRKDTPTYVLLNEKIGKPGPTVCSDCGRVVVAHNPAPPLSSSLATSK